MKEEAKVDEATGLILPPLSDDVANLKGKDFEYFINESILQDPETYQVDSKQNLVSKRMQDGQGLQLVDHASFALYHLKRHEKSINKDEMQIVFTDLTPEQMTTTFIDSFGLDGQGLERRRHLDKELMYSVLLDTTGWLANNLRFGCVKCAPFLTRQKLPMYPLRPQQLMHGRQQIPQQALKEQAIGHNILKSTVLNYNEQNFVAYVNQDNLFGITKEMVKFLHDGESFMSYQLPLPYIEGIEKTDTARRDEALRRQALQSVLNDDDEVTMPPFPHDDSDITKLKSFELGYQEHISLASHFNDMDHLGIEFKEGEDLVAQSKEVLDQAIAEQPLLENYFAQKKHGSDLLKCYPLSYLQGNFTYYHVHQMEHDLAAKDEEIK